MSRALITGITGQDGSYLAELLLQYGYEVYGLVRRSSTQNYGRISHILPQITLLEGDMLDQTSLIAALDTAEPDEVYNLAGQSHVATSFKEPELTSQVSGVAVGKLLEACRLVNRHIRFYQASSSEMFGNTRTFPQTEHTPFSPRSPYGVAKMYAHCLCNVYRESYGMFCCCGILFNHESPRRGWDFVTRKIAWAAAHHEHITLGNLEAMRDWGYAPEYVSAMWLMLQQDKPDDYVVATGVAHSVREFLELAYQAAGVEDVSRYVHISPELYRPSEVHALVGDSSKARRELGWKHDIGFEQLVELMVRSEERIARNETQPGTLDNAGPADLGRVVGIQQVF